MRRRDHEQMDSGIMAGLLVGAMCAVSVYGAIRIPGDTRWPVRFGGFGFQTTLGRITGLILWPVLGTMVAVLVWTGDESITVLALVGLVLMFWVQLAAVLRLARG